MTTPASRPIRDDIEGLRAFAVLAVLANHAFPELLPGGFIGVDVFFAISGYLIGKHLLASLRDGSFSFANFYARRARRIFPALAVVLASVWWVAYLVFTSADFAELGKHMAAAALFSNNILLWTQSDYFDASSASKPLLHLWSLGVEEQFYLLAPALLWLGVVTERRPMAWVARLGVLSLLLLLFCYDLNPSSSFYLIHTRFWELAAGIALGRFELARRASAQGAGPDRGRAIEALLAAAALVVASVVVLGATQGKSTRDAWTAGSGLALVFAAAAAWALWHALASDTERRARVLAWARHHRARLGELQALLGLLLICASCVVFTEADWPGPQTLWPVLGTLLMIAAPATSGANRLLARKPLVFLGGISYPLYLWHWPILVIWRLVAPQADSSDQLAALALSVVLAYITRRWIEDPIRFGRRGPSKGSVPRLWPACASFACAGLLGWTTVAADGWPSHFPDGLRVVAGWSEPGAYDSWRLHSCYHYLNNEQRFGAECTPAKRPGIPQILLWGDSHAGHLYPGLAELRTSNAFDIAQWTTGSCPPTITPLAGEGPACPAKRALVLQMLQQHTPDTVLVSGAWEQYLGANSAAEIVQAVTLSVRHLKARGVKRVVVFGPGPSWKGSLPSELFTHMAINRSELIPNHFGRVERRTSDLDTAMTAMAAANGIRYFSLLALLCNADGCRTIGDPAQKRPDLLFWDRHHMTTSGSVLIIRAARRTLLESDLP